MSRQPGTVWVQFSGTSELAAVSELRRLFTRQELVAALTRYAPDLTTWMVRKAAGAGEIVPDVLGRFAGHRLHLYAADRVPELAIQLSRSTLWKAGTLVLHPRHGAGRVISTNVVYFFGAEASQTVPLNELRPLLSATAMARRISVPRRTFQARGPAKGIYPDYVACSGRQRSFYDATRVAQIQALWTAVDQTADPFVPGSLVLNAGGSLCRVQSRDAQGRLCIQPIAQPSEVSLADKDALQPVVSTRALARTENMSRYKLARLLAAAGIRPIHQDRNTTYYALADARRAVRVQETSESRALSLPELASLTGLSQVVLGRKVGRGLIRTVSSNPYRIAPEEAERVVALLNQLRSAQHGLEGLGICRCHQRGRAGREVVQWDLLRLVQVGQQLAAEKRPDLYQQIAWLCEGTGQRQLKEALNQYMDLLEKAPSPAGHVAAAAVLLPLLRFLPPSFAKYRRLWSVVASAYVASSKACPQTSKARVVVEQLVNDELLHVPCETMATSQTPGAYQQDSYIPGAVVLSCLRPDLGPGIVVDIRKQCWNASAARWDKIVTVRFEQAEQQLRPEAWDCTSGLAKDLISMVVVREAADRFAH